LYSLPTTITHDCNAAQASDQANCNSGQSVPLTYELQVFLSDAPCPTSGDIAEVSANVMNAFKVRAAGDPSYPAGDLTFVAFDVLPTLLNARRTWEARSRSLRWMAATSGRDKATTDRTCSRTS
jgi:hypothetical protein